MADVHDRYLSREKTTLLARPGGARKTHIAESSARGCASRRWFLRFAEPDIHLLPPAMKWPSQKIEFVFSASLETIRREPREITPLRSVGNQQDLAVCALCNSVWFSLISDGSGRRAFVFCHHEFSLAAVYGQEIRDHLAGYGEGRSIGVPFLLFLLIRLRELMVLSGRQLRGFHQHALYVLVALLRNRCALSHVG
jgi:hypothetical protein